MSALTATALYGADPTQLQPTAHPAPDHLGAPEPTMATGAEPGKTDRSPVVLLVAILALVVLLAQVSFRGTVQVRG